MTQTSSGGDFMVDVLKTLDIDYCAINCASSFRGIQEAMINYGNNTKPEILTCTHEEIAVAMAHGYAKMEGKPMAMMCHGVVGLQHAAMALYNAWCDRVPVYVMIGNIVEADKRAPGAEWVHSALDPAALVRDFLKWDDQPASLQHFAESAVRAYKIATTPPMGPVLLSLDAELQENPIADREAPAHSQARQGGAAAGRFRRGRRAGEDAGRGREPGAGLRPAGAHARRHGAPGRARRDPAMRGGRQRRPHELPDAPSAQPELQPRASLTQADVVLGLETNDIWAAVNSFTDRIVRTSRSTSKKGAKIVTLGTRDLYLKSNYQDFARYQDLDLAIAGDGEASLPALTEAVKRLVDDGRKSAFEARGKKLAGRAAGGARAGALGRDHGLGCEPDLGRRACAWRSTTRSRTRIGRWSAPRPATIGRARCGTSTRRIAGTAAPAAPASATRCRPRSARRSPTSGTGG